MSFSDSWRENSHLDEINAMLKMVAATMGVILAIGKQKAFFRDGEWRCASPHVEEILNQATQEWLGETGGPELGSKDPELDTVRVIAKRVHGRVLQHSPANLKSMSKQYLAFRQTRFSFQ